MATVSPFNERSLNYIVNLIKVLEANPDLQSMTFHLDYRLYADSRGVAIHMMNSDGEDYQIYGFFPGADGDISVVTICGQELSSVYDFIGKTKEVFDLPVAKISFIDGRDPSYIEIHINQVLCDLLFSGVRIKQFVDYLLEGNNFPTAGKLIFDSSDHIRYQSGIDVSGHNYGCHRRLVVEKNIQGGEGYTVTMYNLDGLHPIWQNNVQMAPKKMKIINVSGNTVELRGYGYDLFGTPFSAYGVDLNIEGNRIVQATINMFDRDVSIVYSE